MYVYIYIYIYINKKNMNGKKGERSMSEQSALTLSKPSIEVQEEEAVNSMK